MAKQVILKKKTSHHKEQTWTKALFPTTPLINNAYYQGPGEGISGGSRIFRTVEL